jgi:hypothetical protein
MREFELRGLDGNNLLGFLAALGTLRVLTLAEPGAEIRMRWEEGIGWRPIVNHSRLATGEELIETLTKRVCGEASINPAWGIADDLTLSCLDFRMDLATEVAKATPASREAADFLAAFGSDVFGTGPKKERISDTEFRTMSGAGHQHFLGFMRELAVLTDAQHLRRALLEEWDYADGRPSLRWDSADYRPHALRADDPAGDPIKTMRGANRLAVEALPLFPTVASAKQIRTVAFLDRQGETEVTWPIWTEALDLSTVSSLLTMEELCSEDLDIQTRLNRRGIAQIFRARRFTDGKYRNFTPSKALL